MNDVTAALRQGKSGIRRVEEFAQAGLRSEVGGIPRVEALPPVDRKLRRFMPDAALYAYHAARCAIGEARLEPARLANPRTGLIVGSGPSPRPPAGPLGPEPRGFGDCGGGGLRGAGGPESPPPAGREPVRRAHRLRPPPGGGGNGRATARRYRARDAGGAGRGRRVRR